MSEEVQGAVTLKLRCIYYKRPKKNFKNSQVQNITAQSKRIDNAKRVAVQYYGNVCYQNCTVEPDSLPVMKSSAWDAAAKLLGKQREAGDHLEWHRNDE